MERTLGSPCATCASACCYGGPFSIAMSDYERLSPQEQEQCLLPSVRPALFALLPQRLDGACGFLRPWGCSVHERKPTGCRRYDASLCGQYREDPEKVSGRVVLGVSRPIADTRSRKSDAPPKR